VDVEVFEDKPAKGEHWLTVVTSFEEPAAAPAEPRPQDRIARLIVLEGAASPTEIALDQPRTNLGRTLDVYGNQGLSRRNHLAFAEDDEIGSTVSREHAHVRRDPATGEYRMFNDRFYSRDQRESCNIWIIRAGQSQEVHRNTRGIRLQDGDEIHLGRAILQFRLV
jgi:pSer/pThr/pTyr-binding forkhead associated (FHA) protein